MREVVIIDAVRTPVGALGGSLSQVRADDLACISLLQSSSAPVYSRA